MCNSTFAMEVNLSLVIGQMSFIHLNVFIEYQLDSGDMMDRTSVCPYGIWSLAEDTVINTNTCNTVS